MLTSADRKYGQPHPRLRFRRSNRHPSPGIVMIRFSPLIRNAAGPSSVRRVAPSASLPTVSPATRRAMAPAVTPPARRSYSTESQSEPSNKFSDQLKDKQAVGVSAAAVCCAAASVALELTCAHVISTPPSHSISAQQPCSSQRVQASFGTLHTSGNKWHNVKQQSRHIRKSDVRVLAGHSSSSALPTTARATR